MMRKQFRGLVFLFLFFPVFASGGLQALDLRFFGGLGNAAFDPKLEASLGAADQRFEPALHPLGLVSLEGEFSELVNFQFAYERDPVLGNRVLANISMRFEFIRLTMGPFIGVFNAGEQVINPGLAAALKLDFPGVIFASLEAGSTLGSLAALPGEYLQQTGDAALGFWVPSVVCTLSVNAKTFTRRKTDDLLIKDERTRYQFRADVFTKNVPYTVYIDLGYQILKRSYLTGQTSAADELKSLYMGFEGTYRITPAFRLMVGAEFPVYAWGESPLKSPERNAFLYEFRGGLIWTLPEKK
jgi:hypothetical protein